MQAPDLRTDSRQTTTFPSNSPVEIRPPRAADAVAVNRLIAACPPLDTNSVYCNLLQCTDFADTSALATRRDDVVGFVSGYRRPDQPRALFIWQVAVSPAARGQGLGQRLIRDIISRPHPTEVRFVQATITPSNQASWQMFNALAEKLSAPVSSRVVFESEKHFAGAHESEHLTTIGPFGERKQHVPSNRADR